MYKLCMQFDFFSHTVAVFWSHFLFKLHTPSFPAHLCQSMQGSGSWCRHTGLVLLCSAEAQPRDCWLMQNRNTGVEHLEGERERMSESWSQTDGKIEREGWCTREKGGRKKGERERHYRASVSQQVDGASGRGSCTSLLLSGSHSMLNASWSPPHCPWYNVCLSLIRFKIISNIISKSIYFNTLRIKRQWEEKPLNALGRYSVTKTVESGRKVPVQGP